MKYYSFKSCGVETTKFCEPELFGEWKKEGLWMNEWENRELRLPVTMTVKNKYNPGDYPLAGSKLVSQKLLDVIKQVNKDYEALPTRLYYKEKEPIWNVNKIFISLANGNGRGIFYIKPINRDSMILTLEEADSAIEDNQWYFSKGESLTLHLCDSFLELPD